MSRRNCGRGRIRRKRPIEKRSYFFKHGARRLHDVLGRVSKRLHGIEGNFGIMHEKMHMDRIQLAIQDVPNPWTLSDTDCSICREPMQTVHNRWQEDWHFAVTTTCGHVFALSCLQTWLYEPGKMTCPICRASLIKRVHEQEVWMKLFEGLRQKSNHWSLGDLKRQIEGWMDTEEWFNELSEIHAALLWPINIEKEQYRQKAKLLCESCKRTWP